MDIEVNVESTGFAKDPEQFRKDVIKSSNETILLAGKYLLSQIQKATPVGVTGNMRRGWVLKTTHDSETFSVIISNPTEYYPPTEFGRKAAPISKEGMKSLELWVRRKIGIDGDRARSVAYQIARKKASTPTPGQKFVQKTIDKELVRIQNNFIQPRIQAKIDELEGKK